jgi:HK97 family phage prohead protease
MNEKKEIRTVECQLSIREAAPDAQGESRTITGTAIVFNAESEILDDWGKRFREVIRPEACSMEFLNSQDIKLNLLHEREMSIARANKGVGNLHLSVDERGVNFEFEAPRCDLGNRALELIRAGVYSGCSFEFLPQDYDVTERGEDVLITHTKFRAITALTIGMDPAYKQTSVNARELYEQTPAGQKAKEEAEEKAAREERERQESIQREMRRRVEQMRRMADFDKRLESSIL